MSNPQVIPSGASFTDVITITQPILNSAQAILSGRPSQPTRVLVDVVGGCAQAYTLDFIINGNIISWNSMGLQTILSVGDILRVQYFVI